jgi:transcriptional regulator with XRE-family HTH domain
MGLAELRKKRKLTLKQLAALSGVNYMKIHYIEKGKILPEHIMLRTAQKLANALNCEPKDLMTTEKEQDAPEQP